MVSIVVPYQHHSSPSQTTALLNQFPRMSTYNAHVEWPRRSVRRTSLSDGAFVINFKGVRGSPMVCAICIRKTVAIAEQALDGQADQLRSVSQKYENANKLWAAAISNLENKIKVMKQEQTLLSLEARWPCKRFVQCEDLKLKYNEEMAKRKKLHNIVEETKGLQGAVVPSNSTNMGCLHGPPVLARASAGTAGLTAARGAGTVGRAQLFLLPRDDHDCCSHSGGHALQGSECELTTWSATKQVCLGIARLARSVSLVRHLVHFVIGSSSSTPSCADPAHGVPPFLRSSTGFLDVVLESDPVQWRDETVY
uniref:Uncharacterized protein n=1 Tax=Oryza rufipogon TaxID=4529 RepID=A0A0E0NHM1_ORYRU